MNNEKPTKLKQNFKKQLFNDNIIGTATYIGPDIVKQQEERSRPGLLLNGDIVNIHMICDDSKGEKKYGITVAEDGIDTVIFFIEKEHITNINLKEVPLVSLEQIQGDEGHLPLEEPLEL